MRDTALASDILTVGFRVVGKVLSTGMPYGNIFCILPYLKHLVSFQAASLFCFLFLVDVKPRCRNTPTMEMRGSSRRQCTMNTLSIQLVYFQAHCRHGTANVLVLYLDAVLHKPRSRVTMQEKHGIIEYRFTASLLLRYFSLYCARFRWNCCLEFSSRIETRKLQNQDMKRPLRIVWLSKRRIGQMPEKVSRLVGKLANWPIHRVLRLKGKRSMRTVVSWRHAHLFVDTKVLRKSAPGSNRPITVISASHWGRDADPLR